MSGRRRKAGTLGPVRRGRAIEPIKLAEAAAGGVGGGGGSSVTLPIVLTTDVSGDLPFANLAQIAGLSVLGVAGNSTADVAAITAGSDKQVLRRSGTGIGFGAIDISSAAAVTGDLALANLAQGGALSVLGIAGNATADYADIVAGSDKQVMRRSGTTVGFGAIDISSASAVSGDLAFSNLAQGSALSVLGVTGNATADVASIVAGSDGQVLVRSGATVVFGAVSLSTAAAVTGKLPWANLADVSATSRILGRRSAGSGVIEEMTLSQTLDLISSAAQGDVLFRGAASWQRLPIGTANYFLQSQGAGADLVWGTAITGSGSGVLTGTGNPQGVLAAAIGNLYYDTVTGYQYRKVGGASTAYGWYPVERGGGFLGPQPVAIYLSGVQAIVGVPRTNGYGYWMPGINDAADTLGGSITGTTAELYVSGKRYHSMATDATSGHLSTLNTNTTNPRKVLDDDVDVWIDMRTDPSVVTNVRYSFGISSAAITDVETPGSASNGSIMLRFSTAASDGGWVGSTQLNGAGNTTVSATVASIAAATLYRLRVRFVRSGTPTAYFSVNDSTEVAITSNIPATGSTYFLVFGVTTKTTAARSMAWRSIGGSIGS